MILGTSTNWEMQHLLLSDSIGQQRVEFTKREAPKTHLWIIHLETVCTTTYTYPKRSSRTPQFTMNPGTDYTDDRHCMFA